MSSFKYLNPPLPLRRMNDPVWHPPPRDLFIRCTTHGPINCHTQGIDRVSSEIMLWVALNDQSKNVTVTPEDYTINTINILHIL